MVLISCIVCVRQAMCSVLCCCIYMYEKIYIGNDFFLVRVSRLMFKDFFMMGKLILLFMHDFIFSCDALELHFFSRKDNNRKLILPIFFSIFLTCRYYLKKKKYRCEKSHLYSD